MPFGDLITRWLLNRNKRNLRVYCFTIAVFYSRQTSFFESHYMAKSRELIAKKKNRCFRANLWNSNSENHGVPGKLSLLSNHNFISDPQIVRFGVIFATNKKLAQHECQLSNERNSEHRIPTQVYMETVKSRRFGNSVHVYNNCGTKAGRAIKRYISALHKIHPSKKIALVQCNE